MGRFAIRGNFIMKVRTLEYAGDDMDIHVLVDQTLRDITSSIVVK